MAIMRRTALIEAPLTAVASAASHLDQDPAFACGLRPAGERRALTRTEGDAGIAWTDGHDASAHRLTITVSGLAGNTTWTTWLLEGSADASEATPRLEEVATWLGRVLNSFRDQVEAEYQANRFPVTDASH
jgi:hypothetical protein